MSDEVNLGELFAEYEENAQITVLDAGKHKLVVANCTPKGKGIMPVYKVAEGPNAGKRVMAGVISPGDSEGGRFAFFRKLEKFGLTKEFFALRPTLADVGKALVGRVVILELGLKEWNGEPRNELGFSIELVSAPALPGVGGVPVATPATAAPAAAPVPANEPPAQAAPPAAVTSAPAPSPAPAGVSEDPGF